MFENFLKFKKPLAVCVALLWLVALGRCFFIGPLAHKIAPSTIHVDEIDWTGCTQIDEGAAKIHRQIDRAELRHGVVG